MENLTVTQTAITGRHVAGTLSGALLQGINIWSVVGNILIIITIFKTPGLRGFSGAMMVNQAVADILIELTTVSLYVVTLVAPRSMIINVCLRLAVFAFNGVVAHSLSALSVILYLAICRQQQFKGIITWNRVYLGLTISWLMNAGLVSLYLISPDFYTESAVSGEIMLNLTKTNCWLIVAFLSNIIAIPFVSAVVCYIRIHNYTKSYILIAAGMNNKRKLKLSQMIHIVTIIFLLTYIPLVVVVSLKLETSGVRAAAAIVNYSYHGCKLFIYLKFYAPLRTIAKQMCRCCCHNRIASSDNLPTRSINVRTIETSVNARLSGNHGANTSV